MKRYANTDPVACQILDCCLCVDVMWTSLRVKTLFLIAMELVLKESLAVDQRREGPSGFWPVNKWVLELLRYLNVSDILKKGLFILSFR